MRKATDADVPRMVEMGRKYHAHYQPPWQFDDAAFAETLIALMNSHFVNVADGGFLAGTIQANPLSPEWVIARELLWWSEDGGGLALAAAFRDWAKQNGAREIQWSCPPENQRVCRFYSRFAMPTEAVYSEYV